MKLEIFALVAMMPAAVGPLPPPATTIEAGLCGGGTTSIPIPARSPEETPCHVKGCHATCSRKRFDPTQ